MESYVSGDYAVFWVEVPSIPASPDTTTIYIYYGKSDATTTHDNLELDLWQLREYDSSSNWNPDIIFNKSDASVLRIDSATTESTSLGTGYAFIHAKKDYLNGKKIRIRWRVYYDYNAIKTGIGTVFIVDNPHLRTKTTDEFEDNDGTEHPIANYTYIKALSIDSSGSAGWSSWTNSTSSVLDLSNFTSNYVTILIRLADSWSVEEVMLDVDYLQILDSSDNVLKTFHFTESVVMEQTGTTRDYGLYRKYVDPEPTHGAWGSEETSNQPPNAPTLDSPAANTHINPSASITFSWTFNDPDSGDSQSAYQFQLDDNSDFSSPIIDTGKVSSSTSSTTQTLPSTVGLYYWRVKTWDSSDAEGAWSSGRAIVVDRVQITLSVADSRINVGETMSWSFTAVYEYDGADATSYVSVSLNDTATKSSVGKWVFTVSSITETQYGLTAFTSNTVECIWDRVIINLEVSDTHVDVGATIDLSFDAIYEYDGADATDHVSVTLNDTLIKNAIGKYYYTVDSITDSLYGLTVFECNVVYVIFDRVNFTLSAVNERVDVGKEASITVSAVYAYDGSTFEGTYSLNDTLTKSEVGKYGFKVASMTDTLYGLTVFTTNEISIVWDMLNITFTASDCSPDLGEQVVIYWNVTRVYDGSAVTDYSITVLRNGTSWISDASYGEDVVPDGSGMTTLLYNCSVVTDNLYGLTAFTQSPITITWHYISKPYRALNTQLQNEGNPYIVESTHLVTSLSYSSGRLTYEVNPVSSLAVTAVKSLGYIPRMVYVDGVGLLPEPSRSQFNSKTGVCWYYDEDLDIVYVKVAGSTVEIEWHGYVPSNVEPSYAYTAETVIEASLPTSTLSFTAESVKFTLSNIT